MSGTLTSRIDSVSLEFPAERQGCAGLPLNPLSLIGRDIGHEDLEGDFVDVGTEVKWFNYVVVVRNLKSIDLQQADFIGGAPVGRYTTRASAASLDMCR